MGVAIRQVVYIIAFLICSAVYGSCDSSPCDVAVRAGVENLRYRVLSPSLERDRVERSFYELAALHTRCPSVEFPMAAEDCSDMGEAIKNLDFFSPEFSGVLHEISRCNLPAAGAKTAKQPDISQLIAQTLKEQQDTDGEAVYWIADDLLAFSLVYPEQIIDTVLAHPSFRERFISSLGGNAFEDLDDTPGSKHKIVHEKKRAFANVLRQLPRAYKSQPGRARLISDVWTACGCATE